MTTSLKLSHGQYSDKGRKASNQDFHGALMPRGGQLSLKGASFAIADGISSSPYSHEASETAVKSFLDDYYCTSEAWSVKHAGCHVIAASNAWLYTQSRSSPHRYNPDKGYVTTFSALVLKGDMAHLFHIGDSRIYRLRNGALELLTKDHRLWVSSQQSYLSRALGMDSHIETDYLCQPLRQGDLYLLATDGMADYLDAEMLNQALQNHAYDLDLVAMNLVRQAFQLGSDDNLTLQLVRVEQLPAEALHPLHDELGQLPMPPLPQPGELFDGYRILRQLHASSRSHLFLAQDLDSAAEVVLKLPSIDLSDNPDYLERLLLEEWIARRCNNAHLMKAAPVQRPRHYIYSTCEHIQGQTLSQWMIDNPQPELEQVRQIIEQLAKGLQALHRREILHQDLRPENILIDASGTVKIIDFGAARVAGISEATPGAETRDRPGTALYSAPEYFLDELPDPRADLYSLGVISYQLLSGQFPYGNQVSRARTPAAQRRLSYGSLRRAERPLPFWLDETLRRAVHPNPWKRYQELSEFIYDLRHPNPAYKNHQRPPLLERNPVAFWQGLCALLACVVLFLLNP